MCNQIAMTEDASARAIERGTAFVPQPDLQREWDPEQVVLVARVKRDEDAFWRLWQTHSSCLFQICLREMNGNREDAEDAFSQAMMKALNKLYIFAPRIINPKAWLIRLTRNLCRDIHRTSARRHRLAGRVANTAESIQPDDANTLRTAGHRDPFPCGLEHDLGSMIYALPLRLREVCVLRFTHELSYKEIAARLALTQPNVRKRIQQARAMLRAFRNNSISGNDARWVNCPLGETPANITAKGDSAAAHSHKEFEIPAPPALSRTICVRLPSGLQGHFEILVDKKPSRQRQKIRTLRKYVERHASGWKKRLELANLLYETGAWQEAIDGYRHVLKKQPWLTAVSVRLGEILRLTGTEEESIAVYELALPLARRSASRCHLKGLIASCHFNFASAIMSFQEATVLEPDNAAHWHALTLAYRRLGYSAESLLRPLAEQGEDQSGRPRGEAA
jgi:RNA polymerase sigma factor (sigma-70 family)